MRSERKFLGARVYRIAFLKFRQDGVLIASDARSVEALLSGRWQAASEVKWVYADRRPGDHKSMTAGASNLRSRTAAAVFSMFLLDLVLPSESRIFPSSAKKLG
jgi:hypothetical protein